MTARRLLVLTLVTLTAAIGAGGVLTWAAQADSALIAAGVKVAGVPVGGLTPAQATERVRHATDTAAKRPVTVRAGGEAVRVTADQAQLRIIVEPAVARAMKAGKGDSWIKRGWRKLRGQKVISDFAISVVADRKSINRRLDVLASRVAVPARNAELNIALGDVRVTAERNGRRLAKRGPLLDRVHRALTTPVHARTVTANIAATQPKLTAAEIWERDPVTVTVSKATKTVRVFKRGVQVKRYRVAIGQPQYPTPEGLFRVQSMQVNPTWTVPRSDWAGSLAGQVIPGGDPRNPLIARWIGFNGSVGFHGTPSVGSLGSAASHGCVRMAPRDVKDLYRLVSVGTPVLVA